MINAELHVLGGKHAGQVIPLNRQKFLIGREQDCQLRPNSELVSRHHCVFTVDEFSVRVRDLGSTNGTLVNDERIQKEVVLQPDDRVVVGSLEFSVRINEVESGESTGEVSVKSEETLVAAGTQTVTEMTPVAMPIGSDTTLLKSIPTESADAPAPAPDGAAAAPVAPAMPIPQMPVDGTGDTTVMAAPMPMPMPGQPYPQMPGQPYPQMPQAGQPVHPGYPYQPVPGQMPQAYPPGFQGQVPPVPYPYPQQVEAPADTSTMPGVTLPDPSETGAKDAPPKATTGEKGAVEEDSNSGADAIIKQYMQRRPGG
jgi:predicted component of type VI protein secretion system